MRRKQRKKGWVGRVWGRKEGVGERGVGGRGKYQGAFEVSKGTRARVRIRYRHYIFNDGLHLVGIASVHIE
jgi:hypothetical protein